MADQTEFEFMREARIDGWAALADHFRRRGWLNAAVLVAELEANTRAEALDDLFDDEDIDPEGVTEQESPGAGPAETGTGDDHEA